MTAITAAKKWGITAVRVMELCRAGRVPGAIGPSRPDWWIPDDANKPEIKKSGRPRK